MPTDTSLTHAQQIHYGNSDLNKGMKPGIQPGKRRAFPETRNDSWRILPTPDKELYEPQLSSR